jgi:hypothetical protein
MMRQAAVAMLAGCGLFLLLGCGSSPEPIPEEPAEAEAGPVPEYVAPTGHSAWSAYLQVMSDKERTAFLSIAGDFERRQWLRAEGVDVRAELSAKLSRGMAERDATGRIADTPDEVTRSGATSTYFYSRFNGAGRTNFWLRFEEGRLSGWNTFTVEQQDRVREVLEYQQTLMRRFNTVLRRGMGMHEIRRQAENARANLNRVELAYRETLQNDEYRGGRRVSSSDYVVAEQLQYARAQMELYEWFLGREPSRVIVHRPFETHRYESLYRDRRGNETELVVEFVFEDGRLVEWFVFYER